MSEPSDTMATFAIGALPEAEARAIELLVPQHPELLVEIDLHRETANRMLEAFRDVDPAPAVWHGIERSLDQRHARRRWLNGPGKWLLASAAVAAALLLVTATGLSLTRNDRASAAEELAASPGSRTLPLADPATKVEVASVVVGTDGAAYFLGGGLAPLTPGRTYQLWSVVDGQVVSAGLLGPVPEAVAIRIEAEPDVLAVTAEQEGGVVVSEQAPVAVWSATG